MCSRFHGVWQSEEFPRISAMSPGDSVLLLSLTSAAVPTPTPHIQMVSTSPSDFSHKHTGHRGFSEGLEQTRAEAGPLSEVLCSHGCCHGPLSSPHLPRRRIQPRLQISPHWKGLIWEPQPGRGRTNVFSSLPRSLLSFLPSFLSVFAL